MYKYEPDDIQMVKDWLNIIKCIFSRQAPGQPWLGDTRSAFPGCVPVACDRATWSELLPILSWLDTSQLGSKRWGCVISTVVHTGQQAWQDLWVLEDGSEQVQICLEKVFYAVEAPVAQFQAAQVVGKPWDSTSRCCHPAGDVGKETKPLDRGSRGHRCFRHLCDAWDRTKIHFK